MPHTIRVPTEIERRALLDVLKYAILDVRNHANEMTWEQVSHLMDAVHNIPYYLETNEEHYWNALLRDMNHFDERRYDLFDLFLCGCLMGLYEQLKMKHVHSTEQ